jgi:hypothetical protein
MSPKELTAFRVDEDVMAGLRAVKARDFIPLSVQVDQALRAWLKSRGIQVGVKTGRKRAVTRKRP